MKEHLVQRTNRAFNAGSVFTTIELPNALTIILIGLYSIWLGPSGIVFTMVLKIAHARWLLNKLRSILRGWADVRRSCYCKVLMYDTSVFCHSSWPGNARVA